MSVDLYPILIDEKVLTDEIERLRKKLPPEQLDSGNSNFKDELAYDWYRQKGQYSYARLDKYKNTRWASDADSMRFQMLTKAWAEQWRSDWLLTVPCADALYQFFGAFFCSFTTNNPFNEYGFKNSTIISPANSRRLHLLFQQINFELLRPVFNEHCKQDLYGLEYGYIRSFEELVYYARALDGLLLQAMKRNQMLYIFAAG